MLDIIIPTYKNKEGLRRTLQSINPLLLKEITVTIIDDYSEMYYNDIFEEFPFITIFYSDSNCGPGCARNLGMRVTSNPYITFIDTGDYFINNQVQENILSTIKENSDIPLFTWQFKIGEKISKDTNNHLHGRIYKRDFLTQYNINFCEESSYTNEDIGFNRACRLIIRDRNIKTLNFKEPVIVYDKDENSITNKNNGEFFYRQQNKGLALNTINTIKIAEKNNISAEIILNEINTIMASLYYTFIRTKYERPEFLDEAWEGAKLFFDKCFSHYSNDAELIITAYSVYVKQIYFHARKWKNFKPLNYGKFLKDLRQYSIIPSWYNN